MRARVLFVCACVCVRAFVRECVLIDNVKGRFCCKIVTGEIAGVLLCNLVSGFVIKLCSAIC